MDASNQMSNSQNHVTYVKMDTLCRTKELSKHATCVIEKHGRIIALNAQRKISALNVKRIIDCTKEFAIHLAKKTQIALIFKINFSSLHFAKMDIVQFAKQTNSVRMLSQIIL